MPDLKHVGRMKNSHRKVLVAFRTLPGESDSALIVQTENLSDAEHDALMSIVESPAGQNAYEFGEVMARASFPEGGLMLQSLHAKGKLTKVKTSDVEMMPNLQITVGLDQLNQLIAEQKGISVNDLALGNITEVSEVAKVTDISDKTTASELVEQEANPRDLDLAEPLTDEDLAKKYRSDADRLSKEAAQLRRLAEELVPSKKKAQATA